MAKFWVIPFSITLIFSATSCDTIGPGLVRLAQLDAVCVTGYTATWKPKVAGAFTDSVDFQANFTNPQLEDARGSIEILMYVRAEGIYLGSPASNVDAQSKFGFATPTTTSYPAKVVNGYISPVAVTVPYDARAKYSVEIKTNIPGQNYDGKPCHTFALKDFKVAKP